MLLLVNELEAIIDLLLIEEFDDLETYLITSEVGGLYLQVTAMVDRTSTGCRTGVGAGRRCMRE